MMKSVILLLLLTVSVLLVNAQSKKEYKINGTTFYTLEKTEKEEGVSTATWIELYRVEDGKVKYLLKHITNYQEADHSGSARVYGKMLLKGNVLEFYTYWCWAGDMPIHPFGGRKQVYRVNYAGKLVKEGSQLYVENIRESYIPEMIKVLNAGGTETKGVEGQVYLHQIPKNAREKQLFAEYISAVEEMYHADFVFGKASNELMKKVRLVFKEKIKMLREQWNEEHKQLGRPMRM